jgi:hypothetical protein
VKAICEKHPWINMQARTIIAFFLLFVFIGALSVGAYFITDLGTLLVRMVAHERQTASPGATASKPTDAALRRQPSGKLLQMIVMATKAADETNAAADKLSSEVEPPALARDINLATASRSDLEALRGDLKTAEANATALMPRYAALLKAERDRLQAYAASLHTEKSVVDPFMAGIDMRHAQASDLMSRLASARAEYYRAYDSYVAVLAGEFGTYQVVAGQFIFPLQRTVDRYNVAARAMTSAAARVAELQEQQTKLLQSQRAGWQQLVDSK